MKVPVGNLLGRRARAEKHRGLLAPFEASFWKCLFGSAYFLHTHIGTAQNTGKPHKIDTFLHVCYIIRLLDT